MMSLDIRLNMDPIRTLGFAAIGATYAGGALGAAVDKPVRIFYITNLTNANLMYSFNGIDDHFVTAANGYIILDITANKTVESGFFMAEGDRLYVRYLDVPTSGDVYFSTFFGGED